MAGGGGSGRREENYYPGFVDALANVVLVLIFVLVVFVFAMAMSANKVEERMREIEAVEAKLKQVAPDMTLGEVGAGEEQGEGRSQQSAIEDEGRSIELSVNRTEGEQTRRGATEFEESSDRLIIHYPSAVIDLDEESLAKLDVILEKSKEKASGYSILLRSYAGNEPFSAANRSAYYRALILRKHLIEKGYGTNDNIESKVIQPARPTTGHVEIIFTAQ